MHTLHVLKDPEKGYLRRSPCTEDPGNIVEWTRSQRRAMKVWVNSPRYPGQPRSLF